MLKPKKPKRPLAATLMCYGMCLGTIIGGFGINYFSNHGQDVLSYIVLPVTFLAGSLLGLAIGTLIDKIRFKDHIED